MYDAKPMLLGISALTCFLALFVSDAVAETLKRGGILTYVVPSEPPSFDGHRENTYGLIHPIAPFCSTLIRVNPENPSSLTDIIGNLALEITQPTDGEHAP